MPSSGANRVPAPLSAVGGMDVAALHQPGGASPSGDFHDIFRIGANDWGFSTGDLWGVPAVPGGPERAAMVRAAIRSHAAELFLPSAVLSRLSEDLSRQVLVSSDDRVLAVLLGRLELDVCGAWVTLAIAGYPRPIVVRQAGWIDVRGNAGAPLGLRSGADPDDDRVGLGPGDALVVCSDGIVGARDAAGGIFGAEALPDLLLDCIGRPAADIAVRTVASALEFGDGRLRDDGVVLVIRVPEIPKSDALARVSKATGTPIEDLQLPGYPVGDVQPERWRHRSDQPREARIRLAPEPSSVPALRRLLRRLLQSWRMEGLAAGDIELLATEVATNSFTRVSSDVTVIVRAVGNVLRVEVGDGPRPRRRRGTVTGGDQLTGHGLLLVEALSSSWGIVSIGEGRRIWFEVPASPSGS